MDKFGIFKLLNSFLTPSEQQTAQSSDKKDEKNSVLNDLLSSLNYSQTANSNQNKPTQNENKNAPPRPLQSSMLSTMNSHDEFIKRVKINAAKHPKD